MIQTDEIGMFATRENCPCCGSRKYKKIAHYYPVDVLRCTACSVAFLNPYVTSDGMKKIYSSPEELGRYFPFCDNYFDETIQGNKKTRTFQTYQTFLTKLKKFSAGNALMDVGCGAGQFLELAVTFGWDAIGVDFDNKLSQQLYQKKLKIVSSDFLDITQYHQSIDVLTMWDTFEHFSNPTPVLNQCHKLLRQGGLLLIACPKEDSLLAFFARLFHTITFFKFQYPIQVVYLLDHPLFYTNKSMRCLLETQGFEIVKIQDDETDLKRVNFNPLIKLMLRLLFWAARPLGLGNRMILIAKRK